VVGAVAHPVKEDRPSDTALGASLIRSVHQLIDDRPLILEDPVSPRLLTAETLAAIAAAPSRYQSPQARGLRSHVVLRSRYAEDRLHEAVEDGVRQLINVGAGFDTFAFRQPPWAEHLRIVEADHPASQAAKVEYFSNRDLRAPENTAFVPVDLEKDGLAAALSAHGIHLELPTFFACLGVLAYLAPAAIAATVEGIAAIPGTRALVLAFAPREPDRKESAAAARAARVGEPWLTYFTSEEIAGLLKASGFSSVSFLSPEAAADLYYEGRSDLPAPRMARLCMASR